MNRKNITLGLAVVLITGVVLRKVFPKREVVRVDKIQIGSVSDKETYIGTIIPGELVPLYIEAPAVVEKVLIKEGEEVKKGTKLVEFSKKSLLENERQIKINELDIKNTELRIKDLKLGTLKLELDNKKLEIKRLEEKIKNDSKKLPVLEKQAKIYKELLEKGAGCSLEVSKKNMEYQELKTMLELNKEKYNLMTIGYESLKRRLNIDEAQLNSVLSKLKLEKGELKLKEQQLGYPLLSTIEGVVFNVDVTEGSTTSPRQRLLSIAKKGKNRVMLEVLPYQAEALKEGQKAKIVTRDFSGDIIHDGIVERVSSLAKANSKGRTKVVRVEILILGENNLKPGFRANVEISKKEKLNIPVINNFSVLNENGKYYVYFVDKGIVKREVLKIGARSRNYYEVLNLPVGSEFIVNPFKVEEGEKVKVVR